MVKKYSANRILAFFIAFVMVFNITSDLVLSSAKANNSEVAVQNTSEETMAVAVGSKVGGDEYGTGFIFPGNYVFNDKTVTFSDTIPDYLYGKEFIQGNMGGHSDTSSATVETAGVIYVLTRVDSTAQDSEITNFLQQGFVKVNEIAAYALSSGLDRDIAVLKKNVSVGETITWSRWAIVVADSGISFTQRASVKIDLAIRTFEEGQELYHDRTGKLIGKVPEILKNVPYVYSSIDSGINNAPATVERAGYVYIMTPIAGKSTSQQTILEGQGFTKIGMIGKYNFASDYSDPIAVMRKYCNPGETISFGRLGYMIADEATYSSVTSDKFGAAVISTGLPAFNDRTSMPFTDAFPTYLKGKEYLRGNIDGSSTATVTSAGTMYVLTRADASNKDSQLNYFLGQGFVKVDEIAANVFIDRAVAVLKKQVTVGETFTWSRWALLISGSGIELKERAQVMTSCSILDWEQGQKLFTDRNYVVGKPYPALEGTDYLQGGINPGSTVSAKVGKAGWIYVLTPAAGVGTSQQATLEQQGFTSVGKIAKGLFNEQSDIMAVMAKNCEEGETVSFGRMGIMIADEYEMEFAKVKPTEGYFYSTQDGKDVFLDRNYVFADNLPKRLKDETYLQGSIDNGVEAEVTKDGWVVVVTPSEGSVSQTDELIAAGYEKIENCNSVLKNSTEKCDILVKKVSEGETISLVRWGILFAEKADGYNWMSDEDIARTIEPIIIMNPGEEYSVATRSFQGIASIEKTDEGRIWALWYTGGTQEPSLYNYVVLAYSDDNGETWIEKAVVESRSEKTRISSGLVWIDTEGRLWVFANQTPRNWHRNNMWTWVCENPDDDNPTFTPMGVAFRGETINKPTVLSDGTWLMTSAVYGSNFGAPIEVYASIDKGTTWTLRGSVPAVTANDCMCEAVIVEKEPGILWMPTRIGAGGATPIEPGIYESYSYDGGYTWTTFAPSTTMSGPSSRFQMIRLESGRLLQINHYEFSGRSNIHAMLSEDNGETWPYKLQLDGRGDISYPDVIQDKDGKIFVIHDHERYGALEIIMHAFTEDDIIAGKFESSVAKQGVIISSWYSKKPDFVAEGLYNADLSGALASASSCYGVDQSAAAAIDGNRDTMWFGSYSKDFPQTLMVDLGESKNIAEVRISYEQIGSWKYKIYTSLNGTDWSVYGENAKDVPRQSDYVNKGEATARYIALEVLDGGLADAGWDCWLAVREFEVIEQTTEKNVALNCMCAATSMANPTSSVAAALDNDDLTKWTPNGGSLPQSLTVDLGGEYDIGAVYFLFERYSNWAYTVEVSKDGQNWSTYGYRESIPITDIANTPSYVSVREGIERGSQIGRYVRLTITGRTNSGSNGGAWPGIYTFEVYTKTPVVSMFDEVATTPSAPVYIITVPGDGQIKLRWNVPEDNGRREVTAYQVKIDDGEWIDVANNSYVFKELVNGKEYILSVRGVNAKGTGEIATVKAIPAEVDNLKENDKTEGKSPIMGDTHPIAKYLCIMFIMLMCIGVIVRRSKYVLFR